MRLVQFTLRSNSNGVANKVLFDVDEILSIEDYGNCRYVRFRNNHNVNYEIAEPLAEIKPYLIYSP